MEKKAGHQALNMVKLCVGADAVEDLAEWQAQVCEQRRADGADPRPRHVTRMWPRRREELLAGGSLYWVIRGLILVRQRIAALEEVPGEDGILRCGIVLDPEIVRVEPRPRSAFQGWRYLAAPDAPPDLGSGAREGEGLPAHLSAELDRIGVLGRG